MSKPRRRRRFFALEGRFEVDDTGELQGIAAQPEKGRIVAADSDSTPSESAEELGAPQSPVDETLPPAFRLDREPRTRAAQNGLLTPRALLLSFGCLMIGALAGYWWARTGQKPAATDAPGNVQKLAIELTQADENDLDAAYAARHAENFKEAEQLFNALTSRHPDWGPLEVERGRTLFFENRSHDAGVALKAALAKGWKPAEAYFLLGVLNKAQKLYSEAEASFAKAVASDPTEPEYYFFWGECLREEGKLIEATSKFRSALLRNQYETATGLYRVKLWLCAIEADQETSNGVNTQVDLALAEPLPPMEAFVAAAARDLKSGDLRAAADHLSRASQRTDPVVFRYVIGDPFFAQIRAKPEFAHLFRAPAAVAGQTTNGSVRTPAPSPAR